MTVTINFDNIEIGNKNKNLKQYNHIIPYFNKKGVIKENIMNELEIFNFKGKEVRTVLKDGEMERYGLLQKILLVY